MTIDLVYPERERTLLLGWTLAGQPLPKGRPRSGKGRIFTPKATSDEEKRIVATFRADHPLWEPTIEDLRVEIDCFRKDFVSADVDNLAKLVTDALNGVLYADDKQIVELQGRRVLGAGKSKAQFQIRAYILGEPLPLS